jgi:hypothetical protein
MLNFVNMKQFKLNNQTLATIKASTGLDASTISDSDISVVDKTIENRMGQPLTPSVSLGGIQPRGSVYLMLDRLFTGEYINRQLNKIKA